MRILIAASEMVPYVKTGGLGDVIGALPKALAQLGHEVVVALPYYRQIQYGGWTIHPSNIFFDVYLGPEGSPTVGILDGRIPGTDIPVYFVGSDPHFHRDGIYEFSDNAARYILFSRAVIQLAQSLGGKFDIIHVNDWHTALVPVILKTEPQSEATRDARSVLTIHNLAYQGMFGEGAWQYTGLPRRLYAWDRLEHQGAINFLKGGIAYADMISTVSERYALEIQTSEFGAQLEGTLAYRKERLAGILNGIDTDEWNPEIDTFIPQKFSFLDLTGKQKNKEVLQDFFHLPRRNCPVIGFVGRLVHQKGIDLLAGVFSRMMEEDVQFVMLGSGEYYYHRLFQDAHRAHPAKVGVALTFSNEIAHLIEAGADMFLMPSRYEPCGLNQQYSLAYGTIPIVHDTGGLYDCVIDYSREGAERGTSNGFVFHEFSTGAFFHGIQRAIEVWWNGQEAWKLMQKNGMSADWSWKRSAEKYVKLYERALEVPYFDDRQ
ncbi:MAG: glycogen synthase GlgA [Planctomycetes bacterium]|nr:glycogen synthase GlgA [Planctomycetota bacterium]